MGELLADRFELGAAIGVGGMGTVHRALDRKTGEHVAVKIARDERREDGRFEAEIALLAELTVPGIVRYVAHGMTSDGRPFLAMELLAGEDLSARLARGPLSIDDALAVIRSVAEALVEPHRRGIVHRDLKPSNLFLRDGVPERVVVLDFGIARGAASTGRTATGLVVGTPEYMAPEQAQGARDLTPTADVFALGCVLYECLAGKPPFASEHLAATLARVLFEEPRPIETLRPEIPTSLARLVRAMLTKDRGARIADAKALLGELDAIGTAQSSERLGPASRLGPRELALVTVILATPGPVSTTEVTWEAGPSPFAARAIEIARAELRFPDLVVERLGDGSVVIALGQQGESPVDQARAAVRCATALRAAFPQATVAVSTSRRVAGAALGEAIARAGSMLADGVMLDEVTAGLLDGQLEPVADATRLLLGKPTPCVGREQELGILEALARTVLDEGVSRAALVTAPAGVGKSRVRHELLRRLDARWLRLEARGELLRAGSPYAIVGSALLRVLGDDLARGARRVAPEISDTAIALLGELCDRPFSDEDNTGLRAARQDPRVMQAKLAEAFVGFLAASKQPALFVVEDLHWGDRPSIELIGRALRELEERPFLVIAFARPEVRETFGEIWPGRAMELPLPPLGKRACRQLAERVAGDRLGDETIGRIVSECAGNALWLEELIRAASEDAAPDTVLAMMQARIGRLEPRARRVLRAASVFGETFPREGLWSLLGEEADEQSLAELGRREIVEPLGETARYRFRHALMREAAYGLLTDEDRRLGHQLAAEWLERREPDPLPIAEHRFRADDPARAGPWLLRAVERAFERDDFDGTLRLARRADPAMTAAVVGELASYEAAAALMRWDWTAGHDAAMRAVTLLPIGSRGWIRAQRSRGTIAAYRNVPSELVEVLETLLGVEPTPDARLEYADTLFNLTSAATQTGLTRLGSRTFEHARASIAELLPRYPGMHAWQDVICCTLLRHTDDDLATQLFLLREAERLYEVVGGSRAMLVLARDVLGEVLARAGQHDDAEKAARTAYEEASRMGASYLVSHARLALGNVLATRGALDEAAGLARALLDTAGISEGYQAMARDVLVQVHLGRGEHHDAARLAEEAIARSSHTPVRRWLMTAHLADALAGLGESERAFALASDALTEVDRAGGGGYAETPLLLTTAESAMATDRRPLVQTLVKRIRARLTEQASAFVDPDAFASFLRNAPGTARLRALEERLRG